jgi:hypothetical protein
LNTNLARQVRRSHDATDQRFSLRRFSSARVVPVAYPMPQL